MNTKWCYICEKVVPKGDALEHCKRGQHCTFQDPDCAVDTGPGHDHEKPFRCCICKEIVT